MLLTERQLHSALQCLFIGPPIYQAGSEGFKGRSSKICKGLSVRVVHLQPRLLQYYLFANAAAHFPRPETSEAH